MHKAEPQEPWEAFTAAAVGGGICALQGAGGRRALGGNLPSCLGQEQEAKFAQVQVQGVLYPSSTLKR